MSGDSNDTGEKMTVEEAGARGGKARAERLSAARRREIGQAAAKARWSSGLPRATHGSDDHPLRIGEIAIPCYVLDDERRVITQQGTIESLGMSRGGSSGKNTGSRLANFVSGQALKPYFTSDFDCGMQPIKFQTTAGSVAYGYPATVLADICEAILAARADGNLHHNQQHIAARAEVLMRGFARVGIVALVDEATGYQDCRAHDALAEILEAFIAKELRPWVQTFSPDFYKEMFRLRNIPYDGSLKRPQYIGHLTNDVVYSRLAPGVLDELRRKNPANGRGRRKAKHHQWLTSNLGHPELRAHIKAVVTLMKIFRDWPSFYAAIEISLPKQTPMPLLAWAREFNGMEGE